MPRVLVTGGPGAGKTTLLHELSRLGFHTVPESARAVISERLALGLSPRPDPATFALEILRRDIEKYEREPHEIDWVFFDRGVPEALAMVTEAGAMSSEQVLQLQKRYVFHSEVFVLPPWEAIYRQDSERDQTFCEAVAVHGAIVHLYRALGYEVKAVPPAPTHQRAQYVLNATVASGA